ncbi:Glutathione import ATP-binding protein GsiA (plasmid) [Tsukamurella tyrosinosolvens]|uniref:Peptide/nickel transport system ATP-binding protein n=1 Tax=Tsukamurella tyrosinosolvens TaxID=57704 RepID=A0A1H4MYG8_TSUTY|nr:ABC transporter ATP-binding protein [Tsukamurella tyrosinosolvens]AUN39268.1 hypothetical protein ASU32_03945 [Tsukamurella tyrosinosolvens]SEB88086.1 peptide/nickel transport system ATP-binding protein [Tsukamurella tyrosinosolvens]VEI00533.1 Glutathione import ATP-binding protein GsiA [Tsukamurella tyrosinosolvens]
MTTETPLVQTKNLTRMFTVRTDAGSGTLHAVDDADVTIMPATITGLVGESGSGKTTLARLLALYYTPTGGEILVNGEAAPTKASGKEANAYREQVQLMMQDPFASLNPIHSVRHVLGRTLQLHGTPRGAGLETAVLDLLRRVKLEPAEEFIDKKPHEMSGGQRQRVVLARALAVQPRLLLADEPISMLDVSIRAEMLNLFAELRDEHRLALLYITHDIASARYLCDEIIVMYAGQIVEQGPADEVVRNPRHPYTDLLIEASPDPERIGSTTRAERFSVENEIGDIPVVIDPAPGCRFAARCPHALPVCGGEDPQTIEVADGHLVRCWLYAPGQGDRAPSGPRHAAAPSEHAGAPSATDDPASTRKDS